MPKSLFILLPVLLVAGCASEDTLKDPQPIVDAAIAAHGGEVLEHAVFSFAFRGTPFALTQDGGRFEYKRTTTDSLGQIIEDTVDNEGPHRFVDGEESIMDQITPRRINTDLISMAYFARLPVPLNDEAVNKRYVGSQIIRGEPYDVVEVTFDQEGGGRDYQDVFVYWFHSDRHTMDYIAYSYILGVNETGPNATGLRFREAGNVRNVSGYRVQDYRNYTADAGTDLAEMGLMFEAGELRVVSDILLEDVTVEPIAH